MDTKTASNAERCIEDAILELCCNRPIKRFSALAQALPQHSWRALFAALNRLAHQRRAMKKVIGEMGRTEWRSTRSRSALKRFGAQ
jgi:hypothetical protein